MSRKPPAESERRKKPQRARRPHRAGAKKASESCVAEVMGTSMFTVTPDTAADAALRLANTQNVKHFLVVNDGSLAGIVCDTDLAAVGQNKLVSDCMKTPVLCISPETTVEQAAGIMEENQVGCLPVVTGVFLVGVVTRDRLSDLDIHSVSEALHRQGDTCVSCGSIRRVRRTLGSNFIPLCSDCVTDPPRNATGN